MACWDDLKETDVGVFSGLAWDEIRAKYPEMAQEFLDSIWWDSVEGTESMDERSKRGQRVVEPVIHRHTNDASVLLVTHGGVLQHILATLMGTGSKWGVSTHNTGLFNVYAGCGAVVALGGGILHNTTLWRVNRFNDASHLE